MMLIVIDYRKPGGFALIFMAIGVVTVLALTSLTLNFFSQLGSRKQIEHLNRRESFYSNEIGVWYSYFRELGGALPGEQKSVIGVDNHYADSVEGTGSESGVDSTREFSKGQGLIRRYASESLVYENINQVHCSYFKVGKKGYRNCLAKQKPLPPISPGKFRLEHIGFKEIPFRVSRLFNVRHFAVQSDSKIVIIGSEGDVDFEEYHGVGTASGNHWRMMRLMPDGSIDRSFGDWGYVESYGNRMGMAARKVEILSDGKIVVAGIANGEAPARQLVVVRYLPSGEIDTSFGESGLAWPPTPLAAHHYISVMAIGSDGRIIVGATELTSYGVLEICLSRLHADGSIDKSFGTNGLAKYRLIDGVYDYLQNMAQLGDGKILLAGYSYSTAKFGFYWVVRLLSDGALDTSFGISGKAVWDLSSTCEYAGNTASAMTLTSESIYLGGSCTRNIGGGQRTDPIIIKWTKEGAPDTSFSGTGYSILDVGHDTIVSKNLIKGIVVLDNGSLLAVGRGGSRMSQHVTFWRVLSNGSVDSSFGKNGELYHKNILFHKKGMPLGGGNEPNDDTHYPVPVTAIRELSGGKILVAGGVMYSTHFFISRHTLDGSIDTSFATDGIFKGSLPITYAQGASVVIQNDGKTVVGGFANQSVGYDAGYSMPLLSRITQKLEFDSTFGGGIQEVCNVLDNQSTDGLPGRVNLCPPSHSTIRALWDYALDENGKTLGTGSDQGVGSVAEIAIGRYNPDGSIDKSFAEAGFNNGDTYASYSGAGIGGSKAVLPLPDGKIIVVSTMRTSDDNDPKEIGLLRFNSNGSLDNSFGEKGIVRTDFNTLLPKGYVAANVEVKNASLQSDGKVVVVGHITLRPEMSSMGGPGKAMPNPDILVSRFLPTGTLDTSFGWKGYERIDFKDLAPKQKKITGLPVGTPDDSYDYGLSLLIEETGKILVGGCSTIMQTEGGFSTLARFDADGVLDPSFGNKGRVIEDIDLGPEKNSLTDMDCMKGLIPLPDGRIMAAISFGTNDTTRGWSQSTEAWIKNNIAYIVYAPDGTRDTSFGENGLIRYLPGNFGTVIEDIATRGDIISAVGTAIHSPYDHNFIVDMWRIIPQ